MFNLVSLNQFQFCQQFSLVLSYFFLRYKWSFNRISLFKNQIFKWSDIGVLFPSYHHFLIKIQAEFVSIFLQRSTFNKKGRKMSIKVHDFIIKQFNTFLDFKAKLNGPFYVFTIWKYWNTFKVISFLKPFKLSQQRALDLTIKDYEKRFSWDNKK